MKIKSLYISAFGGVKNLKLDFSEGFNLIYGENENGKSTVMAFIKMMFYGSERGSSQLAKNVRKKYTPWDGSPMAGSIDFEHSGKEYRLEREFRSSNSTDKVTLCELGLGERKAVAGDVGVKLLGLSAAAFERSVFIGQLGFPDSDSAAEGEINSRLSNIALTGDESVSFETVNSRLEKAKLALMSKSGRAGEYDKNLKLCTDLKARIEKALALQNSFADKKAKITALETEVAHMLKTAEGLKEKIDAEQDIRNTEKLRLYLELKAQLDDLNQSLRLEDGSVIDEMFLRKLQFCISKVEAAVSKVEAKSSEKERLQKSMEAALNPPKDATPETAQVLKNEISALEAEKQKNEHMVSALKVSLGECQSQPENKKSGKGVIALVGGILFMALAVALLVLKLYVPSVLTALVGVACVILYPIMLKTAKSVQAQIEKAKLELENRIKEHESKISRLEEEIFAKRVKAEAIDTALNSSTAILMNQREMLKETDAELAALKNTEAEEKQALFTLFANYKKSESIEEITAALEEIAGITAKQKELKQELNFISKDLNGISYEDARKKLEEMGDGAADPLVDFTALKEKYEQLTARIGEYKSQIAALAAEAKVSLSNAEDPEALKTQFKALAQKTVAQKEFCDTADIAMQTLLESFAEIRKSYGSVLEKKAGEIFTALTGEKYESMSISKAFDINVTQADAFGNREIAYLSSGTADQAYLSLRLALSELIFEDTEKLPIMLDDSLTQYDDIRMKTAMEFLKEFSAYNQVIMFTCHNSVCEVGKNLGAECFSIK